MAATPKFKGIVVGNDQIQGFILKHGAPSHSKPHGANRQILYYPAPSQEQDEGEFKDFAGTATPGSRKLVEYAPVPGGNAIGTTFSSTAVRPGAAPQSRPAGLTSRQIEANTEIVNPDEYSEEIEEYERKHNARRNVIRGRTVVETEEEDLEEPEEFQNEPTVDLEDVEDEIEEEEEEEGEEG